MKARCLCALARSRTGRPNVSAACRLSAASAYSPASYWRKPLANSTCASPLLNRDSQSSSVARTSDMGGGVQPATRSATTATRRLPFLIFFLPCYSGSAARIGQVHDRRESSLRDDRCANTYARTVCDRYVSPNSGSIEQAWSLGRRGFDAFDRRFNVLPGTRVPVLRGERGGLVLMEARWGFIPRWWSQKRPPDNCYTARVEEAAAKPMWRDAYRTERCLVPAD